MPEALRKVLGLEWIAHCDEFGVEAALNLPGTSITLFPRTMILKRVEKGEGVDLTELLTSLRQATDDMRDRGY